jgi:tetratricopeptide (TPR) repeat protein
MQDISTLIARARTAAFEERFADAAGIAEEILRSLPNCLLALRIQAWAQLEMGDPRAPRTFARCAEIDPEDALAYVGQALWCEQHQDVEGAIGHWVRAWELDPHNQTIRRALVKLTGELPESDFADGIDLLRAARFDEAAEMLRVCAAERRDAIAALALIDALWASGEPRQACELAASLHAAHPLSVKASLYVAVLEESSGHTLRCREQMARAEHIDPGFLVFADLLRQLGLQPALDQQRAGRVSFAAAR